MVSKIFVVFCLVSSVLFHLLEVAKGEGSKPEECKNLHEYKLMDKCCKLPKITVDDTKEREIALSCAKAVMEGKELRKDAEERLQDLECVQECFFNATQMLTPDMKLKATAIKEDYQNHYGDNPKWKEVAGKVVDICIEKDLSSKLKPSAKCKSGSYQMTRCIMKYKFLNCPEEDWQSKEEECKEAKELIEKCMCPFSLGE